MTPQEAQKKLQDAYAELSGSLMGVIASPPPGETGEDVIALLEYMRGLIEFIPEMPNLNDEEVKELNAVIAEVLDLADRINAVSLPTYKDM